MASMSVEAPTLLSFVLCTDGSAQATFADRTVVLLNKGAGAFALVPPPEPSTPRAKMASCRLGGVRSCSGVRTSRPRLVHSIICCCENICCASACAF